jgi:hypothetical protein
MKTISKILIISFILFLFVSVQANAQNTNEQEPLTKFKYGVGGGAGFATGYGLSFRYVPKRFGTQVNFAPFKNSETTRYSLGATFLYMLNENKSTNFYLYQANHFYYDSSLQYVFDPNNPTVSTTQRVTESYFNNGLGFGVEIIIAKRVGLNFMAGYAAYDNFKGLNVTGELALYYKF